MNHPQNIIQTSPTLCFCRTSVMPRWVTGCWAFFVFCSCACDGWVISVDLCFVFACSCQAVRWVFDFCLFCSSLGRKGNILRISFWKNGSLVSEGLDPASQEVPKRLILMKPFKRWEVTCRCRQTCGLCCACSESVRGQFTSP